MVVRTTGSIPAGRYIVSITGKGTDGPPVHIRKIDVYINSSLLTVGTNRSGIASYIVNGITYNNQQQLVFPLGSNVTVQAVSPRVLGLNQYVFVNWSNGGDTTQTIALNSNQNLSAFYKIQYRLVLTSTIGNSFGGNVFYDSASQATFGVLSRTFVSGGTTYYFRGWTGTGAGSYTSPDSSGIDSAVTLTMGNPFAETARWTTTVGINQISSAVPDKFNLYNNYPNPFNPATVIKFDVAKNQLVKIIVFDLLGQEVSTLINQSMSPGSYSVDFDGNSLSSGMYFYRIETSGFIQTNRMMLVK